LQRETKKHYKLFQAMSTKSTAPAKTKWKITKEMKEQFSEEFIVDTLLPFNQVDNQKYYMVDYFRKKVIVDSSSSPVLCGYPKELLDEEGFDFFKRILPPTEMDWLKNVIQEFYPVFFATPVESRKSLVLSYELTFITVKHEELVLHHKIVPFQLCDNGNLWLSLCSVSEKFC